MPAYDGKVIAVFALLRELTYNNCAFIRRKLMKVKQFLAALLLLSFSTLALADPFFRLWLGWRFDWPDCFNLGYCRHC